MAAASHGETPAPAEVSSPVLANIIVVVGFVVLFTTFATDSPWSWIIGGLMVVAGGLWAGFSTGGGASDGSAA